MSFPAQSPLMILIEMKDPLHWIYQVKYVLLEMDLPHPGIKPMSPAFPALQADSLRLSHQGSPQWNTVQP